jgi:hypothetical protein
LAKVPTAVNITNEVRKTRYSDIPEKLLFVWITKNTRCNLKVWKNFRCSLHYQFFPLALKDPKQQKRERDA